jgi:hypothetical protein
MVTLSGFRRRGQSGSMRPLPRSARRLIPLCAAIFTCIFTSSIAHAMFVSDPEKKQRSQPAGVETQPGSRGLQDLSRGDSGYERPGTQKLANPVSSNGGLPETACDLSDVKLRREMENILSVRPEGRKHVSNTFVRMSGRADGFKRVTLPTPSVVRCRASVYTNEITASSGEKTFKLACWAFVASCFVAASVVLLKIKKHTTSTRSSSQTRKKTPYYDNGGGQGAQGHCLAVPCWQLDEMEERGRMGRDHAAAHRGM